ncbi:hypothetical protein M514_20299 [Trichuris suis]|uniref:Uncharacterized protein n=1 Tax=Trichuris suis TaxID=68888 RepID=A0A085NDB2_9BILA|nr:hypothetical protein M514_20299 [Trichuris suis]
MQYAEVTYLIAYKVSGTEEEEEASANDQECYCKGNEMKVRVTSYLRHKHGGRVVKALDLRSNGQMSAWVRTPPVLDFTCYFISSIDY